MVDSEESVIAIVTTEGTKRDDSDRSLQDAARARAPCATPTALRTSRIRSEVQTAPCTKLPRYPPGGDVVGQAIAQAFPMVDCASTAGPAATGSISSDLVSVEVG